MNIKFGMNNFYTRYLKRFLNSEYQQSSNILGRFDKNDLNALIKYLDLPNTETIFDVYKGVIEKFPELQTLFNMTLEDDRILFICKSITTETEEFLNKKYNDISEYCASVGWKVSNMANWIDHNMDINSDGKIDETDRAILNDIVNNGAVYSDDIMKKADLNIDGFINYEDIDVLDNYMYEHRLSITLQSEGRANIFPNEDMKVFVNQFTGEFLYNFAIKDADGEGADNVVHSVKSNNYKIGLFRCKPRSKIDYIS